MMPAKGHKKHECKGCGTLRSAVGDYCIKCIEEYLDKKSEATTKVGA
jgi:hypothetical protein